MWGSDSRPAVSATPPSPPQRASVVSNATVQPSPTSMSTDSGAEVDGEHGVRLRQAAAYDDRRRRARVTTLLGRPAAQHGVAAAQRRAARCRRRGPRGAARRSASDGSSTAAANVAGSAGSATASVHSLRANSLPPAAPDGLAAASGHRGRRRTGTVPARRTPRP